MENLKLNILHLLFSGCWAMTLIAHLRSSLFSLMAHSLVSNNKLRYIALHIDVDDLYNYRYVFISKNM